ncbi:hypothetical protein Tco_0246815 [Tanacetum coccineum]
MSSYAIPVSSEESVGSSTSLIILSDSDSEATTLPAALPIAPEAKATMVVSPAGILDSVLQSDSESDSSEDFPSSDHALVAPSISPFLSEPNYKSEPLEDPSEEDT